MDVLVIGSGGREHALAWRLARDEGVRRVRIAPGNGGTAAVAEPVDGLDVRDVTAVARHAARDSWQRVSDTVERATPGDSDRDGR